jgi:pantoate--beta-alanine ligase
MIIFKKATDLIKFIEISKAENQNIGFVPTMGALHFGHLSLIQKSNSENNVTICSIFVNPTQFNNQDDFNAYPITIENDINLLELAGCDALFLPSVDEIYPDNFIKKHYNLGAIENILEGKYRPGHFQGVCMVVERLLEIVPCHHLYLGQKDYQQCMVLEKMIELSNINTKIVITPTVREKNGLAMSSRNKRLNESEIIISLKIFETLSYIKKNLSILPLNELKDNAINMLAESGFDVDYVEISDLFLNASSHYNQNEKYVGLIAASLHGIRLIDNMLLN